MAQRQIQLLRNASLFASKAAAKSALEELTGRRDGELVLARYTVTVGSDTVVKSLLGIFRTDGTNSSWTYLEDASDIEKVIANLDYTLAKTDGNVVTSVSQSDGAVSAGVTALSDVLLTGYTKTNDTGSIAATDSLEVAFSKIENQMTSNHVTNGDASITVETSGASTEVSVNVKSGTNELKLDSTNGLYVNVGLSALTAQEIAALSDENVKEAYQLTNDGTKIGDVIKIYKDSALVEVYLGTSADTINATTGEVTKQTSTDPQSLNFVYHLADGTYSLTKIDVSKFLSESEFGDGLQVSSNVVSVKVDSASGTVTTANGTGQPVLSVSSSGVKVDNIQAAIDYASSGLTDDIDDALGTTDLDYDTASKGVTGATYIGQETTNTVVSDMAALDAAAANTLDSISGSNAINVTTKANKAQTVSLILDDSTNSNDNVLGVTNDGLYLSAVWDCGTYGSQS